MLFWSLIMIYSVFSFRWYSFYILYFFILSICFCNILSEPKSPFIGYINLFYLVQIYAFYRVSLVISNIFLFHPAFKCFSHFITFSRKKLFIIFSLIGSIECLKHITLSLYLRYAVKFIWLKTQRKDIKYFYPDMIEKHINICRLHIMRVNVSCNNITLEYIFNFNVSFDVFNWSHPAGIWPYNNYKWWLVCSLFMCVFVYFGRCCFVSLNAFVSIYVSRVSVWIKNKYLLITSVLMYWYVCLSVFGFAQEMCTVETKSYFSHFSLIQDVLKMVVVLGVFFKDLYLMGRYSSIQ